jgi:putative chitinase
MTPGAKKIALVGLLLLAPLVASAFSAVAGRKWAAAFRRAFGQRFGPGAEEGLEALASAWARHGDGDPRKLLYILCAAWHESRLRPIEEIKAAPGSCVWEQYQSRYWPSGYYGRGFVQITWRDNYRKMGELLGLDLVGRPDLALRPGVAAEIMVRGMMLGLFTGKRLGDYINAQGADWYNARRTIGAISVAGQDTAALIQGHVAKVAQALQETA